MRILPCPYITTRMRDDFRHSLPRCPSKRRFLCKLRSVSHADNATIEAATREYGVDAERIRAWCNPAYYIYRRTSRSTIRNLPRIEACLV